MTTDVSMPLPQSAFIGVMLAVVSAVFLGSAGPITKALASSELTSLHITQARMTIAAILLLLLVLATNPRQLGVARSEWPLLLSFGLLAFFMNQTLYTIAVSRIPVGIALLLEYLAPVLIVLWIRFVRKKILPNTIWIGVGSVIVGLCLVGEVWLGFHLDTIGVIAGIGTAIALAAKFLLAERGLQTQEPAALAAIGATIGAVALNIISPASQFPWHAIGHHSSTLGGIDVPLWALLSWLAVVSTVFAYLTGISAQRYLAPAPMSQLATLEVVFAAAFAALLLEEHLTLTQVTGAIIMLVGVLAAQFIVSQYKTSKNESIE